MEWDRGTQCDAFENTTSNGIQDKGCEYWWQEHHVTDMYCTTGRRPITSECEPPKTRFTKPYIISLLSNIKLLEFCATVTCIYQRILCLQHLQVSIYYLLDCKCISYIYWVGTILILILTLQVKAVFFFYFENHFDPLFNLILTCYLDKGTLSRSWHSVHRDLHLHLVLLSSFTESNLPKW